ncbi:Uncharacterised protein [Mycobacterium tuberculosis]|nr:Uncharacterised protein [Mycobacterium tuberculosis]
MKALQDIVQIFIGSIFLSFLHDLMGKFLFQSLQVNQADINL